MKTALWELQVAIKSCLESSEKLMSNVTGVYDFVRSDAVYPYIEIGDDTSNDDSTKTFYAEDITVAMHVWSQYPGKKECKVIIDLIGQVLEQRLVFGGYEVSRMVREFVEVFRDGEFYHGIVRFRVYIKQ
jgi:hypothetical protein